MGRVKDRECGVERKGVLGDGDEDGVKETR